MNTKARIQGLIEDFIDWEELHPIKIKITKLNKLKDLIIIRLQILNLDINLQRDTTPDLLVPEVLIEELTKFIQGKSYDILEITSLFDKNDNPIIVLTTKTPNH